MKKLPLSYILDLFFLFVISFLVSIVWIRYFLHNVLLSIILSFWIALFISVVIMSIKIKKNEKEYSYKIKNKQLENLHTFLKVTNPSIVLKTLQELSTKNNKFLEETIFEIKKNRETLIINNKYIFIPYYLCDTACEEDVLKLYHKHNKENYVVIIGTKSKTELLNSKTLSLIKNLLFFDILDTFNEFFVSFQDIIPNYEPTKKHLTFKKVISVSFSRAKVKPYLICGICLLFFSFIVRYNLFYIIEATILLVLATISYFYPKKQII